MTNARTPSIGGKSRLLVLFVILAGTSPHRPESLGFSYFLLDGAVVVWAGSQSIRYLSPTSFPPDSEIEGLIVGAMGLWNLVPAGDFEYFYSRLDQDYPIDHFDGFNDTAAVPASQLDPGVLGVTYMVNMGTEWFDMDLVFSDSPENVGYDFDPNPDCNTIEAPTSDNGFSFVLIATHELGHALGLGHDPIGTEPPDTQWFVTTMNPRYPAGGPIGQENIVEVHADDRNGVRSLYPHSGLSGPPMVDLALAGYCPGGTIGKAVPLFFDPPGVFPGESILARSVIENFGTTSEFFVRQGFYLSEDERIDVGDLMLGYLEWDIAFGDTFQFDVLVDLPDDMPAGEYTFGAILDDVDEIDEEYEDNNAVAYCDPLTVRQHVPAILPLNQQVIPCGARYIGTPPAVTHPLNMAPITWSLDNPEPGMTIDAGTGVIRWDYPVHSTFLYTLRVRATNEAGSSTALFFLGVEASEPRIIPMSDQFVGCPLAFVGSTPLLTSPDCMMPILEWSLVEGPAGMSINPDTGVLSWVWNETGPHAAPRSPVSYPITIRAANAVGSGTSSSVVRWMCGDLDGDGSVDHSDFALLAVCQKGPCSTVGPGCECADTDNDRDVDLSDVRDFQIWFGQ